MRWWHSSSTMAYETMCHGYIGGGTGKIKRCGHGMKDTPHRLSTSLDTMVTFVYDVLLLQSHIVLSEVDYLCGVT